jgi:hypothetical protein
MLAPLRCLPTEATFDQPDAFVPTTMPQVPPEKRPSQITTVRTGVSVAHGVGCEIPPAAQPAGRGALRERIAPESRIPVAPATRLTPCYVAWTVSPRSRG